MYTVLYFPYGAPVHTDFIICAPSAWGTHDQANLVNCTLSLVKPHFSLRHESSLVAFSRIYSWFVSAFAAEPLA